MTAQVAQLPTSAGAAIVPIVGAAAGVDTYPPCVLYLRNTGAGTHVVTITINALFDGLPINAGAAPGSRTFSILTGASAIVRLPASYADANGRIGVSVDGTSAEVLITPIGA